jgi:hypothetical protein
LDLKSSSQKQRLRVFPEPLFLHGGKMHIPETEDRLYICPRCKTRKTITEFSSRYCINCEADMKKIYNKHANETAKKAKKYIELIRETK